jgi:CPA2 family monovalent cation:H+ antiporter-2
MLHLAPLIQDLTVILISAALATYLCHRLKQPVVVGYLLTGLFVGPYTPFLSPLVSDLPNIQTWADLGIIFLMFSLGLEFSFRKLSKIGLPVGITATWEIGMMFWLGFGLGYVLNWGLLASVFLGCMLSISSTTIIFKALEELDLKSRSFASQIFGVLIVEDLVVILMLATLSGLPAQGTPQGLELFFSVGQLFIVMSGWIIVGYFVVPRIVKMVGRIESRELLTIISVALCLMLATFSAYLKYSVALGAFIMGSILSETLESKRIQELIQPLRDTFVAIFFVTVGMLMDPSSLAEHWGLVLLITGVLVFGKILNITLGSVLTGMPFNHALSAGFSMAQIGEFSFLMAAVGVSSGALPPFVYPVIVAVSIVTTFLTPYLIRISTPLADHVDLKLHRRLRQGLNRYYDWLQKIDADTQHRKVVFQKLARWVLSGVVIVIVFVISAEYILPWLTQHLPYPPWARLITWILAIALSAPFVWGMFSAFQDIRLEGLSPASNETFRLWAMFLTRILTVMWIGLLSIEFFSLLVSLIVVFGLAFGLFVLFYKQLETSYQWLESRFLSTFVDQDTEVRKRQALKHLAPWDAHLFGFKVHPNSEVVGKRLVDIDFYDRVGTKVIVIQRGLRSIVGPESQEVIYPNDELLLLGSDQQLEKARALIEEPFSQPLESPELSHYQLKKILVTENSPYVEKSIRQVRQENTKLGMVVGIEREGNRFYTPHSDLKLIIGDLLYIVTSGPA